LTPSYHLRACQAFVIPHEVARIALAGGGFVDEEVVFHWALAFTINRLEIGILASSAGIRRTASSAVF